MRRTRVFGPAYIDRVLRVDRPLVEGGLLNGSVDGRLVPGEPPFRIGDEDGSAIVIHNAGRGGPLGGHHVLISGRLGERRAEPWTRSVQAIEETSDLGGMGAGFAAALSGELVSAIGPADESMRDPVGAEVVARLAARGIVHSPIRVEDRPSDWSLIVTSGPFGDKLAIGFRGCHSAVSAIPAPLLETPCDLLVVAGLPNRLIGEALNVSASLRFVAPAMRNMVDREVPFSALSGRFDVLSCNRREWEALDGRETVALQTPIVAVTDGPAGCLVLFHDREGRPCRIELPAFPRDQPPRDTNRAGEAFASTLVSTLLDLGWHTGTVDPSTIRRAAERASAAAGLVLDREEFGFPSPQEIDAALSAGRISRLGASDEPRGETRPIG